MLAQRAESLLLVLLAAALTLAPAAAAASAGAGTAPASEPLELASIDAPGTYQVGWRLVETEHRFDGRLDEGASRALKLVVEQENVTDVTMLVEWTEDEESVDVSREDLFALAVVPPDGVPLPTARGREGRLGIGSGALNAIPAPLTIQVANADDAFDRLATFRGEAGIGAWRIALDLVDAGNPKGAKVDTGNSYSITVLVRHYEAVLLRVVSLEPPPLTISQAAKAAPATWLWSTGALAAVALGLGGWLALGARRGR